MTRRSAPDSWGAGRDHSLDHRVALGSLVSVGRSCLKAGNKVPFNFRSAFRAQDLLDRSANHVLSGLPVKPQSRGIGLRVPEKPIAFFDDHGVAFRGVIEERLDERFRGPRAAECDPQFAAPGSR